MAKFFVTTGLSITESARCWSGAGDFFRISDELELLGLEGTKGPKQLERIRALRILRKRIRDDAYPVEQREARAAARAKEFALEAWDNLAYRGALSAELATLRVLWADENLRASLGAIEVIIGESNEWQGLLNWAILQRLQEEGRISAVVTKTPPIPIEVGNQDAFAAGKAKLLKLLRAAEGEICLVASGGYKAFLLGIVHDLAQEDRQRNITVYSLHEAGASYVWLGLGPGESRSGSGPIVPSI